MAKAKAKSSYTARPLTQRARAARASQARREKRRRIGLMLPVGLAAVALVGLMIVLGGILRSSEPAAAGHVAVPDGRYLGEASAPLLISVWEDYQCPFCTKLNDSVLAQIEKEYVATGQARIVYRNFAFLGEESIRAAAAAEIANDMGAFWAYHDALFAAQNGENRGAFSDDRLIAIARNLGLDAEAFEAALDSGMYRDEVKAETAEGRELGVASTPTVFIGDKKVVGAVSYQVFKNAIDAQLAGE